MKIRAWGATDEGKTRDHNEDNFLVDEDLGLFVVADGMGGHAAGEVASMIAAETVRRAVIQNQDLIEAYVSGQETVQRFDIAQVLEHAVQSACSDIYQRAQNEPEKRGMGTTLSLLLVAGERGFVAHVGDSRIYLLRQNQVHQLTEDHSLVNHLIRKGRLKPNEIEDSPYAKYKNAVTRAVGVYESVEVDSLDFDVLAGDRFLLCSDGLSAYLDDGNVLGTFRDNKNKDVCPAFVTLANLGGGHDNITAVAVYALTDEEGEAAKRAEDVRLRMEVMARMPLFAHLTYKQLVRVLNITKVRTYGPKDIIIQEGEPGDELFLVLDGNVDILKDGAYITSLHRGEHLGEMALVDRSPRSATAVAHEQVRLLVIRRQDFYNILSKQPEVAVKLLWSFVKVLSQRLRKTTSQLSGKRLEERAEDLSSEAAVFEEEDAIQPPPIPDKATQSVFEDGPIGAKTATVEKDQSAEKDDSQPEPDAEVDSDTASAESGSLVDRTLEDMKAPDVDALAATIPPPAEHISQIASADTPDTSPPLQPSQEKQTAVKKESTAVTPAESQGEAEGESAPTAATKGETAGAQATKNAAAGGDEDDTDDDKANKDTAAGGDEDDTDDDKAAKDTAAGGDEDDTDDDKANKDTAAGDGNSSESGAGIEHKTDPNTAAADADPPQKKDATQDRNSQSNDKQENEAE